MNETFRIEADRKRRRREFYIILAVIPLIVLLIYLESHVAVIKDVPVSTNILVFGLININIILLTLLIFLILRNTVKLFFESKRRVMGSRLRTKLITAFVALSIIPTFLLFFIVIGFINKSIDGWFDIKIEDSLEDSLELAQNYYRDTADKTLSAARRIADDLSTSGLVFRKVGIWRLIESQRRAGDFATVEVFSSQGTRIGYAISRKVTKTMVPNIAPEPVADSLDGEAWSFVETMPIGDVVRGLAPIHSVDGERVIGAVVVSYYVPRSQIAKMREISSAFENYKQLKLLKNPVKASYFTILLVITLLIVFFSIWIGRYIAREITVPIHELAEATHAVASGDLDVRINAESKDEVGLLVRSFNRMTEDLKAGKSRLEEANLSLRRTNTELEQRRRYIEIVLSNVPAGVISIDRSGRITSLNRVAADMLGTSESAALGSNYKDILRSPERNALREMIREMNELSVESLERQMKVRIKGKDLTVLVNLNALRDEGGDYIGMVAVLDDLTHLLKTQRMLAWKEVARRIAHEIKNPLTPIKLSAQRLRRKYLHAFDDNRVFDQCTATIIRQVEELRILVNEFSSFARMPAADPSPDDLNALVDETVALYRAGRREMEIRTILDPNLPVLDLDRRQIKRVIINLLDNAIAAVEKGGDICVETRFDMELGLASLEVRDTGAGIDPELKDRLFEPYFSTKKSGTGLGLAIVSNIIADHNGYMRVKENVPRGTRFIIEFPVKAAAV
ncbi:MAG TPA: HAMP domain-containing protein [Deltaproteobacteria bacterium]|nr:HAMP domain-containing protein [Deltaproteobacteria bacterium]